MSPHQLAGTLAPEQAGAGARRLLAYLGPATLVSVGYMDPGNWATDVEGGARFGHTLLWVLVAANAFALLALMRYGMRRLEAIVLILVLTVGACLAIEWWLADPQWGAVAGGLRPHLTPDSLYVAVGMLGATVMPHNLYLHSSLVQTRA